MVDVKLKKKLTKYFNKKNLKNPIVFRLQENDTFVITIQNYNFSHHQTWPPSLLKIEHLTKKIQNYPKTQ
jgi:hypothetical protein